MQKDNASRVRDLAVSDSGFVFDPQTGRSFSVNGTGLSVLRALKAGSSASEAASTLAEAFELDPSDDARRDVEDFIARLRHYGLMPKV